MAIAEAALGAVFGELLKTVLENIDKAVAFKRTLVSLQSTLIAIAPVIEEIEQHNKKLGRPKEELESLMRQMEEGTKLVCECSKVHRMDLVSRVHRHNQLVALGESLEKFFRLNMQAQMARDQKETLAKVRRIQIAVNKLPFNTVDASSEINGLRKEQSDYYEDAVTASAGINSGEHRVQQIKVGNMGSCFIQEMQNPQLASIMSPVDQPITVIGPQYCTQSPIILEIVKMVKKFGFSDQFSVKNVDDKVIFNLERPSFSIHARCTLFDDDTNPVVTLHSKRMTAHNRWEVFRGTSDQRDDLLFNVKQHHIIQLKARLDVFLATNTEEKVCDFMVGGSWTGGSYVVYAGDSGGNVIAQISKYIAPRRFGYSKDGVVVRVKANVDSAFIVTLMIVILSLT